MACLRAVQVLPVSTVWIGAGFVRTLVWDALAQRRTILDDVDVIWFDPRADVTRDHALESMLRSVLPEVPWSVRNQARMHARNGDAPYASVEHAMTHWPETATAVAVRLDGDGDVEVLAPFGLADLFDLKVRPTPHMTSRPDRRGIFAGRSVSKGWEKRWPGVVVEHPPL
ncbi:MAG: nucleotidyltransferase family protein [Deltaproteobacteria bacterium]|nr:nucleotidyltransferase family protein [Deltaproteobacteria bacterium]